MSGATVRPQKPTLVLVKEYVDRFEKDDWQVATDKALDKLFMALTRNCAVEEVYLKVVALNDLYGTQLRRGRKAASALYDIAKEICSLAVDSDLAQRRSDVVDKIAAIKVGGKRCGYVFASKYCHFHAPADYPICEDSAVEPLVYAYQKSEGERVRHDGLKKNYTEYKKTVENLISRYGIGGFGFRPFDKFLLGYGREWNAIRPKRTKKSCRREASGSAVKPTQSLAGAPPEPLPTANSTA